MNTVMVIGRESAGKSQLIASLTGLNPYISNFRGSTLRVESYRSPTREYLDTPGISFAAERPEIKGLVDRLQPNDTVLVVAKATHLDDDLRDLLPLAEQRRGVVAVTFWDKVAATPENRQSLATLSARSGLPVVPVDARRLADSDRAALLAALDNPQTLPARAAARVGWRIEPARTLLEHRVIGPLLALVLLFTPAVIAVWFANTAAAVLDPLAQALFRPLTVWAGELGGLGSAVLAGRFGAFTMFPLLFVWALPTVLAYAGLLAAMKASGLIERLTAAVHPLMRPFSLTGRDLVRVLMGFGCNVPAVISTRACASCTRKQAMRAIAFGSACSYQLGATLSVFAAAARPELALAFGVLLTVTSLIYLRLQSRRADREAIRHLAIDARTFLEWPRPAAIWREARGEVREFLVKALPIFLVITVVAAVLDAVGALPAIAGALAPTLALFDLPLEAALPVLLSAIRKDGLLLFAEPGLVAALTPLQILTGVFLAGQLLPCLVTLFTLAREQRWRFALATAGTQALAATAFSFILAWGGRALGM